ncbi:MAG: hypothetical protein ACP5HU_01565 [Phycisphaerae bacterium]
MYALPGLRLAVGADEAPLLGEVDRVLSVFADGDARADAVLNLSTIKNGELPSPEPEAQLTWQGVRPNGLFSRYWSNGSLRQMDLANVACACVDLSDGRAEIAVRPESAWAVVFGCLTPVLGMLLQPRGRHMLHGATVAFPSPPHRSALIVGASGAGKSTTALACASAGLRLLADDSSVLSVGENGCELWGLPRPCKVHRRTMELCPHLASLPSEPVPGCENERAVELRHISPPSAAVTRPEVVIVLQQRNDLRHRLTPLAPVEALTCLLRGNLRTAADPRAAGPGGKVFAALAELTRRTRCYSLSASSDMPSLGRLVRGTLERAV